MLRFVLLLLVCANVLYAVWSQGLLAGIGLAPENQSEPWRMTQQMRADSIALLHPSPAAGQPASSTAQPPAGPIEQQESAAPAAPAPAPAAPEPAPTQAQASAPSADTAATASSAPTPDGATAAATVTAAATATATAAGTMAASAGDGAPAAAPTAPTAPAAPGLCLQAGPFDEEQTKTLRAALRNHEFPWDSYELRVGELPGRWMVYLGKFPNLDALAQRRKELRALGVDNDRAGGNLELGLSLGRFSTEEAATRELTRILRAGVRGSRVVQERAATTVYTLHLPAVSGPLQVKLKAIEPALAGKAFRVCNKASD